MSSVGEPGMVSVVNERPKLDATSFQKLLAAAWAIQCQHDAARQSDLSAHSPKITIPDGFFEPAESRFLETTAPKESPLSAPANPGTMTKLPPQSVRAAAETAGALALATDRHAIATRALPAKRPPSALRLVINQHGSAPVYTIRTRDFRFALIMGAAVLLLAVIAAVWGFRIETSHRNLSHRALPSSSAVAQKRLQQNKPRIESSHLRITDSETAAELEQLSRYEIRPLQRQATFGDEGAALMLGMSYETGLSVHQNCAEAAHWMRVAAEAGNAAAQYNLGLRYLYGDGVSADRNASIKWLSAAAKRGYKKAQNALREVKK